MKHQKYGAYLAAGVTAFAVIAAAILLFFVIYHFSAVRALLELLAYILRPIFYGLVLAFLLLPVHRQIYSFLAALCEGVAERGGRKRAALNFLAIVLSLIFAVLVAFSQSSVLFTDSRLGSMSELSHCSTDWAREL